MIWWPKVRWYSIIKHEKDLVGHRTVLPDLVWQGFAESEVIAMGVSEVVRSVREIEGTVNRSSSTNVFFRRSRETVFCFPPMP